MPFSCGLPSESVSESCWTALQKESHGHIEGRPSKIQEVQKGERKKKNRVLKSESERGRGGGEKWKSGKFSSLSSCKPEESCHLCAVTGTDQQPDRQRWLLGGLRTSSLRGTNLDSENLITVQTCICAVVGRTLKREVTKRKVNTAVQILQI